MPTKRPGPPKKSRLQRRLTAHELRMAQNALKKPALKNEPRWFQRIYVSFLDFLGLRAKS